MSDQQSPLFGLSAIKLALMAKQVRAQSQQVLQADPIAIVGMACRVPGGGDTPEQYWQLLRDGADAVRPVPSDRWDGDAWYDADLAAAARSVTREAGFLDRIDGFDADYFGILPREAERMDPQQRLFLEVAMEALDDAGLSRERLRGSRTGVFIASYHNDYAQLQYGDLDAIDARTLTGTLHSVLANRLSFFLDLHGPSLSIDTACSSSLVATHLACQSLRCGESDVTVAGGVSLIISPELMVSMSKVGFMAPDGRCKTFDASANGFGRGEGCGIVVLKRLADAIADGDRVLAVVRGSAVNQDGHSTLLAAPSGPAQQALIREALASAQLDAGRIGYVETHGTGTALGDPIEVEAIAAVLGRPQPDGGACLLGSAKANLGHLEAAAGVVGLIKTVLMLHHEAIPPQVHFRKLSPHISLAGTRLAVPTRLTPWPAGAQPRCAAASSFGVGGTNAHVIVEEAPKMPGAQADEPAAVSRILPLSAHTPAALRALVEHWERFLADTTASEVDLCYTAGERRTHHDCRVAAVGRTKDEWRARLADALADASPFGSASGRRVATAPPRLAFVFSGQGPQWFAMGRELLADEPVFAAVMRECDALLLPLSGWSLLDALAQPEALSRLDQTEVAQPALFALQVALCALWKSWGIAPDGCVGHSVGEIAALHVAGVLTLPEAVRVVWHRGRIMQQATGTGRMASVGLTPAEAFELVQPHGQRLGVGAINGPRSVVLSGEQAALESALARLSARGVSHRMLPVQYAFHSAQMAPFQHRVERELSDLHGGAPTIALYSTVTGAVAAGACFDAAYFGRNVRDPVLFANAIDAMAEDGFDVFLEIGPHPVLAGAIAECLATQGRQASVLSSLRRGRAEREAMLQASAGLYAAGCMPDWAAFQQANGQVASLPAYPWQRQRHWLRDRPAAPAARRGGLEHELLGRRVSLASGDPVFEGDSQATAYWLDDHRIFGRPVLPAAAVIETLVAAARVVLGVAEPELSSFTMHRPVFLPEPGMGAARWQTVVTPGISGTAELNFFAAVDGTSDAQPTTWQRTASATASASPAAPARSTEPEAGSDSQLRAQPVDASEVYARYAELGVVFGPAFRTLEYIRRSPGSAQARIRVPDAVTPSALRLHPILLDCVLQLCSVAAAHGAQPLPEQVMLPVGADRIRLCSGPAPKGLSARVSLRPRGDEVSLTADAVIESSDGELVAAIDGLRFAPARAGAFDAMEGVDDTLYEVIWHAVPHVANGAVDAAQGLWLIFADRAGDGDALAKELTSAGGRCVRVFAGGAFEKVAPQRWIIDPADPDQFRRLLAEVAGFDAGPLRGAVHLWSLDLDSIGSAVPAHAAHEDLLCTGSAMHLTQALAGLDLAGNFSLGLVSRGAQAVAAHEPAVRLRPRAAGLHGLAGVIALEHPELQVRALDLDPADVVTAASSLCAELLAPNGAARQVAWRGAQRLLPRLQRYVPRTADPAAGLPLRLEVFRPGTLDGVALRQVPRVALQPDEVRLQVLAAGVNFRDVLLALGLYPGTPVPLGAECAGIVIEVGREVREFVVGQRVFGFVPASLGSEAVAPTAFLAAIPASLSAEDAAALPIAYLTAFYGLHTVAQLRAGERVLIHSAAGGVGLAAVQLAQRCGAEVFATAGSDEKRALLRSLGVKHVMDSRSHGFADEILASTAGAGVQVVLNSLTGEFIASSLRALGSGGRFVELGKRDIWTPETLAQTRPDVRYRAFDLGSEAMADRTLLRPMFEQLLAALADGSLRPLPVTRFALDDAQGALRFMAQARHIGKIVLQPAAAATPTGRLGSSVVRDDASYWITGGLGMLGLETARWLVRNGARHLVLSGRHPPQARALDVIGELQAQGASVNVFEADAADPAGMRSILDDIGRSMPPLRGVVHAAGAVHDSVLLHQRWSDGLAVLAGKSHGAWVLHELTREMPLDFFVLYSAAGVLLGAAGQGVYPAANAELDALAHTRRRLGLPALSIAWGPWAGDGMAAQRADQPTDTWHARGLAKIESAQGFARLNRLLQDGATHAAMMQVDWLRFLGQLPAHADREFFSAVSAARPSATAALAAAPAAVIATRLRALPSGQRRAVLMTHLSESALHALGLDRATAVDARRPLKDIGLDSLMAVELRNTLTRSLGQPLPATLLFDYPTVDALASHLLRALSLEPEAVRAAPAASAPQRSAASSAVAELSDDQAEALLLEELERADMGRVA